MLRALSKGDYDAVYAQMPDGSYYKCEVMSDGSLLAIAKISPPASAPTYTVSSSGTGSPIVLRPKSSSEVKIKLPKGMMIPPELEKYREPEDADSHLGSKRDTKKRDPVFQARLKSVMTDNKYNRLVKARNRGKLDMTRLHKARTGETNIFTQKQERKGKEYNIVLVIDESGSMDGHKIKQAAETAIFLARNFEMPQLNVNLAIVGFNHWVVTHKGFEDKVADYDDLERKIIKAARNLGAGCNHDYDALEHAYKLLNGRKGTNIVIFTSDGQPASCREIVKPVNEYPDSASSPSGDYREAEGEEELFDGEYWDYSKGEAWKDEKGHLNALVKSHDRLAHSIGLGIETPCWQVPENFMVDSVDKLKVEIVARLRKMIRRGV